jgi:hypothetical protein
MHSLLASPQDRYFILLHLIVPAIYMERTPLKDRKEGEIFTPHLLQITEI